MRSALTLGAFGLLAALLPCDGASAQSPPPAPLIDPFPPLPVSAGVIEVAAVEFATLPDSLGRPARMMHMLAEPGTRRLFVNDMNGPLYRLDYRGRDLAAYLDVSDARWGLSIKRDGPELGFQNFVFHPDFARRGARGYGKFYTYLDSADTAPRPDFTSGATNVSHDVVLLEWTARTPEAAAYDGDRPRPTGGAATLRRVMLRSPGGPKTYVDIMGERAVALGQTRTARADLRFGTGPNQEVYLLNRVDGVIRTLRP